jgi:uncharacterized iron-regulated membrane protein
MTLPGWWLNSTGVPLAGVANADSAGMILGIIGLLTVCVLAFIVAQGRWSWQPARIPPAKPGKPARRARLILAGKHA